MQSTIHVYEVRPRNDHRGVDLISDALPFGRLCGGVFLRTRVYAGAGQERASGKQTHA